MVPAQVWNAKSGAKKTFQPEEGFVISTGFSGHGRLAALNDRAVIVWDENSGLELGRYRPPERSAKIVISADGKRLVSLVEARLGCVRIYELDLAELQRRAREVIAGSADIDCNALPPSSPRAKQSGRKSG